MASDVAGRLNIVNQLFLCTFVSTLYVQAVGPGVEVRVAADPVDGVISGTLAGLGNIRWGCSGGAIEI